MRDGLLFMYAVFQIGSKQYRVFVNQIIYVDRINTKIGSQIKFDQVLFIKDGDYIRIGYPFIINGEVVVDILDHNFDRKIEIVKFRRRKHFKKSQGHCQRITKMKIVRISDGVLN